MASYAENRKAHFNYEFLETFEAGLVLTGQEVKAIRTGKAKLDGAYVILRGNEAFLVGASVSPYQPANTEKDYDPERPRKLLFSKKELARLSRDSEQAGLTLVAFKLYDKNRKLKLSVALAKGKKKTDKRESLKARTAKRDIERTLKGDT